MTLPSGLTERADADRLGSALAMLETTSQMLWVGASAGFAFVSAPIAFHTIADLETFATLTERTLERLASFSVVTGGIAIAAATLRSTRPTGGAADLIRAAGTALALGCVGYQKNVIMPAMTSVQRAMGRIAEVPPDDPRRLEYRTWHRRSTRVYGAALLIGTAALAAATLRSEPRPARARSGSTRLDHLVLTVADIEATTHWYARVLSMEPVTCEGDRRALRFGDAKINLQRAEPAHPRYNGLLLPPTVARHPTPGSADLCFTTAIPMVDVLAHLHAERVPIESGPVARDGARRPLSSVYVRDPDGNLVEIANER